MDRIIGVFDTNMTYSCRLADALRERKDFHFKIVTFTDEDRLEAYAQKNYLQLLLVNPVLINERIRSVPAGMILLLTDEYVKDFYIPSLNESFYGLYRFQSVSNTVREVMHYFGGDSITSNGDAKDKTIYGIYSPASVKNRDYVVEKIINKTSGAASKLLLSLAAFSELAPMELSGERDISDAFYYWRQNKLAQYFEELICHGVGYDYIPPVYFPEDLLSMQKDQLIGFLSDMIALANYREIYLDLSLLGADIEFVRSVCTEQIVPFSTDDMGVLGRYKNYLLISSNGEWIEKTRGYLIDTNEVISVWCTNEETVVSNSCTENGLVHNELGQSKHYISINQSDIHHMNACGAYE